MKLPLITLLIAWSTFMAVQPMVSNAQLPPLIPREVLFGNPEKASPRISPDGKKLAWLAPDQKNVLQVWVKTIGGNDDKIITADKKRGIRNYFWNADSRQILYIQDQDGDENFHIYGADLESGNVRDYTPFQGVRASVTATHPDFPNEMLVTLNVRDRKVFDVYRLNFATGALVLDTKNPGDVSNWITDSKLKVRGAQIVTPDGGTELRVRADDKSDWQSWLKVGPDEILSAMTFSEDGSRLILLSSISNDTARVVERNLSSKSDKVLASSEVVDAGEVIIHPRRFHVQAVGFAPGRLEWTVLDQSIREDFEAIKKLHSGDFMVSSRDDADQNWLISFTSDRGPAAYYSYNRASKKGTFMFTAQPKLEKAQLAEMKPVTIKSRDGLNLYSYLTLPVGVPAKNLPMVLVVHGGPWARDTWGYSATAQWLANRGYAVLQVNFRASSGYGKKFLYAGNKQWGLKMHDDLLDAVDWAVQQGYADPKKVAIFGGSYGGYATLAGLAFTPEKFACGVDIVGPSNLRTLINSIPPYWKPMRAVFDVRMGNIDNPDDAELIKNASPLHRADKITRPLLIGQGANDPRVKQAESEQIVEAIEKNRGNVIYVLYPDEGHGFARPENRLDFYARAEEFLAKNLGGRAEPMAGEKYPGSSAVVKVVGKL